MRRLLPILSVATLLSLTGCDLLGIEGASVVAARRDAEGRAVGAGCRQGARSVEQCYGLNKRADKAAVFAGWRDMNDYMRENKLEAMPSLPDPANTVASAGDAETGTSTDDGDKPGKAGKSDKSDKNRH
ncbi:MAG: hypothetical protein ABIN96_14280 [Rubrivivax sp.]